MPLSPPVPFVAGPRLLCPFLLTHVPAGFPSPADDYVETAVDLNALCISNPAATYFMRVEGESMTGAGIHSGDVLVIDRALEPASGQVVVAVVCGEFTVKRIRTTGHNGNRTLWLVSEHDGYPALEVTPEMDFEVWGVVTYVLHPVR